MNSIIGIFIGGGLGSLTRYGISKIICSGFIQINPIATLISNLISTLILGIIVYYFGVRNEISSFVKSTLVIGFCGGFSTFSTFSYEIVELLRGGNFIYAIVSILISVSLSVGILYLLAIKL